MSRSRHNKIWSLVLALLLCAALAAPCAASGEPGGTLTVVCAWEGAPLEGMSLTRRRVAEASAPGRYTLLEPYAGSGAAVDNLTSAARWEAAARLLAERMTEVLRAQSK